MLNSFGLGNMSLPSFSSHFGKKENISPLLSFVNHKGASALQWERGIPVSSSDGEPRVKYTFFPTKFPPG